MPGLRVSLSGDAAVLARLAAMRRAGTDLSPAMRAIGDHLVRSTRARFHTQTAPDGSRWPPLRPATLARKTRNRDKILTERGQLRKLVQSHAGANHVDVGAAPIYAGTHQFGAAQGLFGSTSTGSPIPWGDIPARPYLGLSPDDEQSIADVLLDFIDAAT